MHILALTACQWSLAKSPLPPSAPHQVGLGSENGSVLQDQAYSVTKRDRQRAIHDLISSRAVGSQEDLRTHLRAAGWDVTQSTLSRDLREMRVVRVPTPSGPHYATPESLATSSPERTLIDDVLPQFFSSLDSVNEMIVLKTAYGGAQPVAEAIDDAGWSEVVGTIGGENTILIICRSVSARERIEKRLLAISESGS
jgi:transcriptional regulator of arginine metabolism